MLSRRALLGAALGLPFALRAAKPSTFQGVELEKVYALDCTEPPWETMGGIYSIPCFIMTEPSESHWLSREATFDRYKAARQRIYDRL